MIAWEFVETRRLSYNLSFPDVYIVYSTTCFTLGIYKIIDK